MGALSLADVADIVIRVGGPWTLSSAGDFATFAAFDTATWSVPDDVFSGSFTGNLDTDMPGISGHVIEVNGAITGNILIDEDYWTLEDLTISGLLNVNAANVTIQRVKITAP